MVGLDTSLNDDEANAAISTYYNSVKYYASKRNDENRNAAKLNGRKTSKLNKRKEALARGPFKDSHKKKATTVMVMDFMSSEEDEPDGTFSVRPLRWRSVSCDTIFERLDEFTRDNMSANSKRQMVKRKVGLISGRGIPNELPKDTEWAVRQEH
ncbi:uncharacterized protein [Clytia hemisphaerica]|uniref:uncharacterized protein n=1 Tax=Clytia hemisphaerica TaxID=252671 RepID=UPI0034D65764